MFRKDITADQYYAYIKRFEKHFKVGLRSQLTSIGHGKDKVYLYSVDVILRNNPHVVMCPWVKTRAQALYNAYRKIKDPTLVISRKGATKC